MFLMNLRRLYRHGRRIAVELQRRGNQKVQHKAGAKEVQGICITMGVFPKPSYNGRPHDTSHAPGREHAAVDGAEFFRAKDIGKICRHAGKAAAIAADNQKDDHLKQHGITRTCQQPECSCFLRKEHHIGKPSPQIIRKG